VGIFNCKSAEQHRTGLLVLVTRFPGVSRPTLRGPIRMYMRIGGDVHGVKVGRECNWNREKSAPEHLFIHRRHAPSGACSRRSSSLCALRGPVDGCSADVEQLGQLLRGALPAAVLAPLVAQLHQVSFTCRRQLRGSPLRRSDPQSFSGALPDEVSLKLGHHPKHVEQEPARPGREGRAPTRRGTPKVSSASYCAASSWASVETRA
jgi:hypothetical protein